MDQFTPSQPENLMNGRQHLELSCSIVTPRIGYGRIGWRRLCESPDVARDFPWGPTLCLSGKAEGRQKNAQCFHQTQTWPISGGEHNGTQSRQKGIKWHGMAEAMNYIELVLFSFQFWLRSQIGTCKGKGVQKCLARQWFQAVRVTLRGESTGSRATGQIRKIDSKEYN